MKQKIPALIIGIFVLVTDFISKFLTDQYLPLIQPYWQYPYGGIGIFKSFLGIEFSLSHQTNRGAAWGLLAEYQVPLLYLRLLLVVGILIYFLFFNRHRSWNIPLMLIIAGALGNVIDYFIYGHVVDMLHFVLWGYDFPVFNIADSSIFIGITWLFIVSTFTNQETNHLLHHD